ncbi:metal ABC transporter ATP-binding protein [Thioclava sp. FTW29]|uniref:Metal ABC transporter ATP-binding protein n=1 Tax=Thioclava litoralis TaxID=3076557 RepID=A0ABZ1E5P1_9RHOB|nr:metal ABC transporter ATP-binding protein [Thioclava sp. FTW29]
MSDSLLSAQNLGVKHGDDFVLHSVHFDIRPKEIVTVVGPNGSGKSTLIKALIGLETLATGRVQKAAGLVIGYVPQKLHIDATLPLSVRRFLSLPKRVSDAAARAVLARVGVEGIESRPLSGLSGGQLQRVLLARALLAKPDVLILDEPTQGLDQPGTAAFYLLIEEVRAETGCAVLMVSHDLHVVMSSSDRVICLNGHICCEGTPAIVSEAPEYRALFGIGTGGAFALYQHHHDHSHDPQSGACLAHDHGASSTKDTAPI